MRGSQLSSKALAASGRATWGPPASHQGWVSSSEGVSVGMQERGERGHHIAPQLGFLPPPPSRFTLVPVPGVLVLPEGTGCPAGHLPIASQPPCPARNQTEPSLSYTHPQYKARFIRPMSFADSPQSVCLAASHCSRSHHPHTVAPILSESFQPGSCTADLGTAPLPWVSRNAILNISCSANRSHRMFRGKIGFAS